MSSLRFALRQLFKTPGFTAVAVLTLALGIGANSAIFSVVDRLLERPLPVTEPDRLALIAQRWRQDALEFSFNFPLFLDYRRENTVFSELAATAQIDVGVGVGGATERQPAGLVSGNYFRLLGIEPALGRTFAPDEGVQTDDASVVVLSHGYWRRRLGADPQAVGRSITVNGRPFTVIGVAPREFAGTTRGVVPDLYLPITAYGQLNPDRPGGEHPLNTRFFTWHQMLGRLKEGVTLSQAESEMNGLASRIHAISPANTSTNLAVISGRQGFTQDLNDARLPLRLLSATAALVLLITCANLANLQLIRALGRSRDFAIRLALGAGPGRLVAELFLESLLLAFGGGVAGLLVAVWLTRLLDRLRPPDAQMTLAGGVDPRVLWFTLAVSAGSALLFGMAPAWRASRPNVVPELKGGAGASPEHGWRWGLRGALVVFQVTLSLLVLVCAGLCVRSLIQLNRVDPGFEPSRVVLASLDLGLNNYTQPRAQAFYDQLLERARSLPGVESAALAVSTPLGGNTSAMSLERVEDFEPRRGEHPFGEFNLTTPGYFRTLGIALQQGRDFTDADTVGAAPVVIVNEEFVRRYWPDQKAVGRRIFQHGPNGGTPTEVVGVVRATSNRRLSDAARPALYYPARQRPEQALALTLTLRTGVDPSETRSRIRELVQSLDPQVPVFHERTLEEQKEGSMALQRTAAWMLGGFGLLALLLAALGLYGVLAYSVSRRTREIGIRMAMGAEVADVLRLVMRQGLAMVLPGLVLGLGASWAGARLLRGFLFGVEPGDPMTVVGVVILLAGAGLLACWIPARRAARVDPMEALRND